jgi:hypothetical protein
MRVVNHRCVPCFGGVGVDVAPIRIVQVSKCKQDRLDSHLVMHRNSREGEARDLTRCCECVGGREREKPVDW